MTYLSIFFAFLFTAGPGIAQDPITIKKGEFIDISFTSRLDADDLEDIKKQLAEVNITIQYSQLKFNKKGKLKAMKFEVDCNDGNEGSAWSPKIGKKLHVYFYKDYRKDAKSIFGAGVSRKNQGAHTK